MKLVHVVGAAILEAGKCLVAQRAARMSLAGKWEFPGGKVEPGEAAQVALVREIREELGLSVRVGQLLGSGSAPVGDTLIRLDVYAAWILEGSLQLKEHAQVVWATAEELPQFDWADADVPSVASVAAWLRSHA